jgi:hypothetical protein
MSRQKPSKNGRKNNRWGFAGIFETKILSTFANSANFMAVSVLRINAQNFIKSTQNFIKTTQKPSICRKMHAFLNVNHFVD